MIRTDALVKMLILEIATEQYWFDRMSRSEQQRYVRAHPHTHFKISAPSAPRQKAEMRPGDRAVPKPTVRAKSAPKPKTMMHRAVPADFKTKTVQHRNGRGDALPVTRDVVQHWHDAGFVKSPDEYHRALLANTGLEPRSHVAAGPLGVTVRTMGHHPEHGQVLDATRKFKRDREGKLHVTHDVFEMHGAHQGHGVAKHFLRNSMREYREMSVDHLHTHANLDVGGYAWAKYGFVPRNQDEWEALREHAGRRFARVRHQVHPATRKHVETLLKSDDPRSVWHLSDLQESVHDSRHDAFADESKQGRGPKEHMALGKQLLLGSDWESHLPLKDRDAMNRFHTYVGK